MERATESLINTGAMGAFAAVLLFGGGWIIKRLIDQQQQFQTSIVDTQKQIVAELRTISEILISHPDYERKPARRS